MAASAPAEPVPGNVAPAPEKGNAAPETETVIPQHGLVGSKDKFTLNELNMYPVQPTVEDALGVERIVGPALDNWRPAQVDPDPEDIARAERVAERSRQAREARKEAFTSRHPAAAAVAKAANDHDHEGDGKSE